MNVQAALKAKALMRKHRKWIKLGVRGFNTMLGLGIPMTLLVKDSDLRRHLQDDDPMFEAIYLTVVVLSLVAYYVVCFTDPGYVPTANEQPQQVPSNSHLLDMFGDDDGCDEHSLRMAEETHGVHRRCGYCGIKQPLRTHHCHDCGRCVRRFDHHCPWVETCVGEGTHKYFMLWLAIFEVLILWTTKMTWGCFSRTDTWKQWFSENLILVINMFWLFNGVVVVSGLLGFHSYLMCTNQTTWEMISHNRITYLKHLRWSYNPFHQGYFRNIRNFLCRRRYQNWEDVYFRSMQSLGGAPGRKFDIV